MNKKQKEQARNSFFVLLFEPLLAAILVVISGITPVSSREADWYNYTIMYISLGMNIVLWLMFFSLSIWKVFQSRRAWILEYLTLIMVLPTFLGIIALNLIRPSLPNWKWLIPLILMYPAVSVLPFVNQGISNFLHKELFAPRTKLGWTLLWALPAMGITGATLSQMARNFGNGLIGYAIIGLIFHLLLVWQTASFAQQIWKQFNKAKIEEKDEVVS
jgi:hypothetical protein